MRPQLIKLLPPISLLSLGKRVAGLMHRRRSTRVLKSKDAFSLVVWLESFDRKISPRFSSEVGINLQELMTWGGTTPYLRQYVLHFLTMNPRLLSPSQPTNSRKKRQP